MVKRIFSVLFCVLMMSVLIMPQAARAAPKRINFQGRITPRPAVGNTIVFKINGSPPWQETWKVVYEYPLLVAWGVNNVLVNEEGLFSVDLGQWDNAITVENLKGADKMEIIVNGSSLGEQRLAYVPFAYIATSLTGTVNIVGNFVGIGTDSPSSPLHMHKAASSPVNLKITNAATGTGLDGFHIGIDASGRAWLRNYEPDKGFIFAKGLIDKQVHIKGNDDVYFAGKIGIGVEDPVAALDVAGNVLAKGQIKGESAADEYHLGVLGGVNPHKTSTTTILGGITKAGAYGQTSSDHYGYLGYHFDPTVGDDVMYGVYGYGYKKAAYFKNNDYNGPAVKIKGKGLALDAEGNWTGYIAKIKNESTNSSADGLRVETAGGGHAGYFENESALVGSSHATIKAVNTHATGGTAAYFSGKALGVYASSAKIGPNTSSTPTIKTKYWEKTINESGADTSWVQFDTGLDDYTVISYTALKRAPTSALWSPEETTFYNHDTGVITVNCPSAAYLNGKARIFIIYTD